MTQTEMECKIMELEKETKKISTYLDEALILIANNTDHIKALCEIIEHLGTH